MSEIGLAELSNKVGTTFYLQINFLYTLSSERTTFSEIENSTFAYIVVVNWQNVQPMTASSFIRRSDHGFMREEDRGLVPKRRFSRRQMNTITLNSATVFIKGRKSLDELILARSNRSEAHVCFPCQPGDQFVGASQDRKPIKFAVQTSTVMSRPRSRHVARC